MNPNREELLFQLALSKPAGKRAAWLDAECDGDTAMRQRLEALLAAHEQPDMLLATQAVRRDEFHESPTEQQGLTELDPPRELDEAVGQTLGRYKLLERVGEGGCGVVYVAEQTEPVRRRVALKVIKLGMDTMQVTPPCACASTRAKCRLIPSTSAMTNGASAWPVFTGTFGLDQEMTG